MAKEIKLTSLLKALDKKKLELVQIREYEKAAYIRDAIQALTQYQRLEQGIKIIYESDSGVIYKKDLGECTAYVSTHYVAKEDLK